MNVVGGVVSSPVGVRRVPSSRKGMLRDREPKDLSSQAAEACSTLSPPSSRPSGPCSTYTESSSSLHESHMLPFLLSTIIRVPLAPRRETLRWFSHTSQRNAQVVIPSLYDSPSLSVLTTTSCVYMSTPLPCPAPRLKTLTKPRPPHYFFIRIFFFVSYYNTI